MRIVEVKGTKDIKSFIELPLSLYKDYPNWIRPLDKDIENVFNLKKNKTYASGGEVIRWIIKDNDRVLGRIAAFINPKTKTKGNPFPIGGVGFFESINDQKVADLLFDTSKAWLSKRGIEGMDGPINFGERDKFWGLLAEGHHLPPNYQSNYNPKYYQALFENYGFNVYFKQLTPGLDCRMTLNPKFIEAGNQILADPDFSFEHIKKNNLEKYTEDFRTVYNNAWSKHIGVAEMSEKQAKSIMKQLKPIIQEDIIWFGYFKGEAIAFYVNLPEVNQIFKYVNGKMNLIGKLKFLWHTWRRTNKKVLGVVFGVDPRFDGKGVTQAISLKFQQVLKKRNQFDTLEINWIGDFNPRMISFVYKIGDLEIVKTHHTYRYYFDQSIPFKRMPIKNK